MGIPAPFGVSAPGTPPAGDQANAVFGGVISAIGPQQPFAMFGPMNVSIWADISTSLAVTAGSNQATVGSATGLAVGDAINSPLVPLGTTIGAIVGTTLTLAFPPITLYGKANIAGQITDLAETPSSLIGATVTGPLIPAATTVLSITKQAAALNGPGYGGNRGTVQLSADATANQTLNIAQPFVFTPNGNAVTASGTDTAATFTGSAITYSAGLQLERSFDGGKTWTVANIGVGAMAQFTNGTPINFNFIEYENGVLYRMNCYGYTSGIINYRISATGGAAVSLSGLMN